LSIGKRAFRELKVCPLQGLDVTSWHASRLQQILNSASQFSLIGRQQTPILTAGRHAKTIQR
jgi:hypothetical protein